MFTGFGVAFTLWPLPMGRVVEIPLPTPTARIDFAGTAVSLLALRHLRRTTRPGAETASGGR